MPVAATGILSITACNDDVKGDDNPPAPNMPQIEAYMETDTDYLTFELNQFLVSRKGKRPLAQYLLYHKFSCKGIITLSHHDVLPFWKVVHIHDCALLIDVGLLHPSALHIINGK